MSMVGAVKMKRRLRANYCSQLFYQDSQGDTLKVHFVITKDLELHITAVADRYSGMTPGPRQEVQFAGSEIKLDIPQEGVAVGDGGSIIPLTYCRISKRQVDSFLPGQRIPSCELLVKKHKGSEVEVFRVKLMGAKEPCNYFSLECPPGIREDSGTGVHGKASKEAAEQVGESDSKDVFLSYKRGAEVSAFVGKLKQDLEAAGISVWLDTDDIPDGTEWRDEIGVGVKKCKAFIAVLTEGYTKSPYCKGELGFAQSEVKSLFPLVKEKDWAKSGAEGIKVTLGRINYSFFHAEEEYNTSLEKLIKGLRLKLPPSTGTRKRLHEFDTDEVDGEVKRKRADGAEITKPKSILDAKPTLNDLLSFDWTNSEGKLKTFEVREMFAVKWRDLGIKFGFDGQKLSTIQKNYQTEEDRFQNVIEVWLTSKSYTKYALTWQGLMQALRDCTGVGRIVDELEYALKHRVLHES